MYNKETVIRLNTLDDVQNLLGLLLSAILTLISNIDRFLLMRNHFLELLELVQTMTLRSAIWAMTRHLIMWLINSL